MPRWRATIRGKLKFERVITVYACNAEDAGVVAEELTMKSIGERDECYIDEIYIEPEIADTDINYEIILQEKK